MKKVMRITSLTLILLIMLTSIGFASSKGSIYVDKSKKVMNMENIDGRTYVGDKSLNTLGLNISTKGNIATVKNNKVTLEFTINTNRVKVNGVEMTLDTKTYKKGQEVFVPLRFIMETLGYEVKWDSRAQSISVNKIKEITYPILFEEDGKRYTVYSEPKTIVSLAPSVTEILFAIGAGDKIKGRTQYCTYPAKAQSIQEVGSMREPTAEIVVSLSPDLIIAATHYKEEVLAQFSRAGIPVIAKKSPNTLEEMYEYTLRLGAVVGKNYEARALVSTMKSKVETVESYTKGIKNKPKVYYVVGTGQSGEYTAGRDTFISEIIKVSGGINISDDITGWSYSLEKLIDNNPDIIFGAKEYGDTMKTSPNYSGLKAIKNNNYKVVNKDVFSRPSPRLMEEGLKTLVGMINKGVANRLNF